MNLLPNTILPMVEHHPEDIHHAHMGSPATMRELVFGMEDGMVSTLGAITGIATAIGHPFTIILSGVVIISVESISMGVGSYLASKSVKALEKRKVEEEKKEVEHCLGHEVEELYKIYLKNGWSKDLARKMADEAGQKKELILREMIWHELKIDPDSEESPAKNGLVMGVSYIFGGFIPLVPYFIFSSITQAIFVSLSATLVGLFGLGVFTAKLSKRNWFKAGLEMLLLAGAAAAVGYLVGQVVERFWLS